MFWMNERDFAWFLILFSNLFPLITESKTSIVYDLFVFVLYV